MKRRVWIYFLILPCLLIACNGGKTDSTLVRGELKGLGNDTLYIYGMDKLHDRMDTIPVVNGKFEAELHVDTLVAAWLLFGNGNQFPLFLDKGSRITLEGDVSEWSSIQAKGNLPNEEMALFHRQIAAWDSPTEEQLAAKADSFITSHPFSLVSIYLLDKYFVQVEKPERKQISRLIEGMSGDLKDRPYVRELKDLLDELDKGAVVKIAPYFRLKNDKGEEITRATFSGKYLIINFWASYDVASRRFNEVLKRIYSEEKKNEKFALLNVSLDDDREAWKRAVAEDTLQWEQTRCPEGWNAEVVGQFGLRTIPANFLLNSAGRIEQRDMDEPAIRKLLERIEREEKEKKAREKNAKKRK